MKVTRTGNVSGAGAHFPCVNGDLFAVMVSQ